LQNDNDVLEDKVVKFNQVCERVKEERNNYKQAWDKIEKKFDAAKKKWENDRIEMTERMEEMQGQMLDTSVVNRGEASFINNHDLSMNMYASN